MAPLTQLSPHPPTRRGFPAGDFWSWRPPRYASGTSRTRLPTARLVPRHTASPDCCRERTGCCCRSAPRVPGLLKAGGTWTGPPARARVPTPHLPTGLRPPGCCSGSAGSPAAPGVQEEAGSRLRTPNLAGGVPARGGQQAGRGGPDSLSSQRERQAWEARGGQNRGRGPRRASRQRLLTLGCPSRRTLWRTWQNFQLRMELLGSGRPMA